LGAVPVTTPVQRTVSSSWQEVSSSRVSYDPLAHQNRRSRSSVAVTVLFFAFWCEYVYRYYGHHPVSKQYDLIVPLLFWRRKKTAQVDSLPSIDSGPKLEFGPGALVPVEHSTEIDASKNRRISWMLFVLCLTTILIVVRSIFRCDELLSYNGKQGTAYTNQSMFIGMDASLMVSWTGTMSKMA